MAETQELNMESKLERRRVVFAWDMHYSCNYRCPYCFYTTTGWTELGKKNKYQSPEEWEKIWKRIHDKYGRCQLRVTAGEPFTYPGFVDVIKTISKWHDIQITSNCSYTHAMQRFAREIDPKVVELDCTFHPIWGNFEPFIENVLLLRKHGFLANVCYLAYPPQMKGMAEFKRRFADQGVYMNMAIFWGKIKDKQYPFAYTDEERRTIKDVIGSEVSAETVGLDPIEINGKVCGAGQRYAVIQTDGKVFRCGQLAHPEMSIGNIFEDDFELFKEGKACTVDFCRCKEFQSAWEDEDISRLNNDGKVSIEAGETP